MSEMPRGWIDATIEEVTDYVQRGKSPKYTAFSELPVINQKCIRWSGVDEAHLKYVDPSQWSAWGEDRFLREGDVLWNSTGTGTIGRAAIFRGLETAQRAVADSHVTILRSNGAVLPDYLHRLIQSPSVQSKLKNMQSGSTNQVELSKAEVLATHVPLAPLPEQRRIVTKINSTAGKSKRARGHLNHIPRLIEKYKQAVLAAAFRGDLTREWRRKWGHVDGASVSAEIEIPYRQSFSAPSSWTPLKFEEVCTIEGGSQPPKSTFEYAPAPHLIRFVQIRDYKSDDRITFIPKALARRFCSADDIMIGRYGPPIFQILRGIEGAYNVALMKAVPNTQVIEREYLFRYLNHPALRAYVEFEAQRTAGQDGVNKRHLLAWPILLPPKDEQVEIVRQVDRMVAWVERLASEATSARKLIDHLDETVLAKAFRGELVPQDPEDEPASVLLDRVSMERGAAKNVKRGRKKQA
jgi:type I restriction enzyme S subunit